MDRRPGTAGRRRLEDEFYKVMSRFTNQQWKEFSRSKVRGLSLPDYQIDDIRADYHNDIREQKYQMLSLWQRRNGKKATVEYLDRLVETFLTHVREEIHIRAQEAEPLTHDVGDRTPEGDGPLSIAGNHNVNLNQTAARNPEVPREAVVHRTDHSLPAHTIRPDTRYQDREIHGESLPHRASSSVGPGGPQHQSTRPKETGGVTHGIASAKSEAVPPGFVRDMLGNNQFNINVHGNNATGVQYNFYNYYNDKPEKRKPKTKDLEKFTAYCTKIEKVEVTNSTSQLYEQHWEKLKETYKVSHKPKGAVLIINNSFPGEEDERRGSQVDVRNMEVLWGQIGCKVFLKTEQKAAEAMQCLSKFAKSPAVGGSDFAAVIIMSHGGQIKGKDVFYGADHEPVSIKEVLDLFNNKNARKLQGTPKLFFFQVCRGTNVDLGADASPMEGAEVAMESLERTIRQSSGAASPADVSDAMGFQAASAQSQPTISDTMISFATQEGHRAFRNEETGSWYINAITNVFMRHSHNEHLIELMTKVNNAVAGKTAHNSNDQTIDGGKEMSDFTSTLRKKLFLFPGFPQDNEDEFL